MFARAMKGLSLTPAERSILKLVKSLAFAVLAFILGGQGLSALNAIQQPGANAGAILHDTILTPALMIILLTVEKWFSAQGDAPLLGSVVTLAPATLSSTVDTSPTPASATTDTPTMAEAVGSAL